MFTHRQPWVLLLDNDSENYSDYRTSPRNCNYDIGFAKKNSLQKKFFFSFWSRYILYFHNLLRFGHSVKDVIVDKNFLFVSRLQNVHLYRSDLLAKYSAPTSFSWVTQRVNKSFDLCPNPPSSLRAHHQLGINCNIKSVSKILNPFFSE